jgi:diadenylate cyclase
MPLWNSIQSFGIGGLVQVAVLACAFYYVFVFFHGTRGAQVLVGLGLLLVTLIMLTHVFRLDVLGYILRKFSVLLGLALLIIFQPEIRRALAELGRQPASVLSAEGRTVIDHIAKAVVTLAEHKIGALIAIEREIGTRGVQETGVALDTPVVPELLASIFFPHTPLHDGGAVIRGNRIMAAGCIFPLSQRAEIHRQLGTRHRAAVGLSEETDAVVIVVSEETGTISVCYRGRLSRGLDGERLKRFLSALLKGKKAESALRRVQEQLDLTPEGIAKSQKLAGKETGSGD